MHYVGQTHTVAVALPVTVENGTTGITAGVIQAAFEARLRNDPEREFEEALRQIERIAWLRLKDRLPAED